MSDVKRVLLRAAELCEESWGQGDGMRPPSGVDCHCVVTANGRAAADLGLPFPGLAIEADKAFARHLGVDPGIASRAVIDWNDTPGRTQAEVVAALRAAAEGVES